MAKDAQGSIAYYLRVEKTHQNDLVELREWTNLKVAIEKNEIWITDFTAEQIDSPQVKKLPFKTPYYSSGGQLYRLNSRLPERNEPMLLWSEFTRAAPIKLSEYNHNYFGVNAAIAIQLIKTDIEQSPAAMLTTLDALQHYISTAPLVRLKPLEWSLVNDTMALIFGTPLIPINGQVFWQRKAFFLPVGYDFELKIATELIHEKINPANDSIAVWNEAGHFFKVPKSSISSLSRSSFNKSVRVNPETNRLVVDAR